MMGMGCYDAFMGLYGIKPIEKKIENTMNERIEKLAEQCRIEIYGIHGELLEWGFDEEKFAELIVRECAKAADEGMAQVTMRVEWPSYHIKKHFGVEE